MSELEDENMLPPNSVFHPANIAPMTLLTLLQIKDYLAVIAASADEKATDRVEALHRKGQFLCPPPGFVEEDDES